MGKTQSKQYKFSKELGKGAFGMVYQATKDNKIYAIKKIAIDSRVQTYNRVMQQVQIMQTLKSNFIVEIIQCYFDSEHSFAYIVMQKCDCSLDEKFQDFHSENTRMRISQNIIEAVHFIHSKRHSHRDLKMENILLKQGKVKVSDFGLSRDVSSEGEMTTIVGSNYYKAFQLLAGSREYTNKVDSWALGIILLELWSGKRITEIRKGFAAVCDDFPRDDEIGSIKNEKMKQIVKRLLVRDESRRATVTQIYNQYQLDANLKMQKQESIVFEEPEILQQQPRVVRQFHQSIIFIEPEVYSDEE